MFTSSAQLYDAIYSTFKDYPAEARQIGALLRRAHPGARTILDVACGTGEHARLLHADGFVVDGLDLDPAFVRIAAEKHPAGRFFQADMADFHLDARYDAILCLFSSIAYLCTIDRVTSALRCFREHLASGGVAVVEPWFVPGVLDPARVAVHEVDVGGMHVVRTGRVGIEGRVSRLSFEYEITDAAGTRRASEIHELGLFTPDEMLAAFGDAGLHVDYDPEGLTGRGLYTGGLVSGPERAC